MADSNMLSSPALWILVSVIVGALGVTAHFLINHRKKCDKKHLTVPGPTPSHPQQGNLPDVGKAGGIHQFLSALHKQYGPIVSFWWGTTQAVSLASPGVFKQIAKLFNRPYELFKVLEPLITKDGMGLSNGESARCRHAAYSRCFNHGSLRNYYNVFEQLANDLVSKWTATPGVQIAIEAEMFLVAIKALSKSSFGQWFNNDDEIMSYYHHHMEVWNELEVQLVEGPPELGSDREKSFSKSIEVLRETMRKSMKMRKELGHDSAAPMLIDVIMEVTESEGQRLGDALALFFSGFHTTGMLLTWCLYYLAKHQDVQEKLYQELCEVLGDDGAVDNDNIGRLVYTRQVLDETLRCSALLTYDGRYSDSECTIDGHILPAKTPIYLAMGVVVEDETLWPNPEMFDPERFSHENQKVILPYAFEPFGFAGKRKCPGYRFALVESTTVFSILIRKFKIHLADESKGDVTKLYSLVTAPREKILLQAEERLN